jgi:hypothetical protein
MAWSGDVEKAVGFGVTRQYFEGMVGDRDELAEICEVKGGRQKKCNTRLWIMPCNG